MSLNYFITDSNDQFWSCDPRKISLIRDKDHVRNQMMALLSPLILLALVVSSVSSARIAGFMALGGSQYINMKHIMETLASRGHQVDKQSV